MVWNIIGKCASTQLMKSIWTVLLPDCPFRTAVPDAGCQPCFTDGTAVIRDGHLSTLGWIWSIRSSGHLWLVNWRQMGSWRATCNNNDPRICTSTGNEFLETNPSWLSPGIVATLGKVRTFAVLPADVVPHRQIQHRPWFATLSGGMETQTPSSMEIKAGESRTKIYGLLNFGVMTVRFWLSAQSGRWLVSPTNFRRHWAARHVENRCGFTPNLGMALSDAGVKCWGEKYRFNCLRPIDYIREYMNDPNWNTNVSWWFRWVLYPNFRTYPSGHVTLLPLLQWFWRCLGKNYTFTDRSHEGRTEPKELPEHSTTARLWRMHSWYCAARCAF